METTIEASPQRYARIGGALYLFIIVAGGFAEGFVRSRLIVSGDAGATARNILGSMGLWRFSVGAELALILCAIALAVIEFGLLRPVSRYLASLSLAINLVSIGVEAIDKVLLLSASSVLAGGGALEAFGAGQREALAYLLVKAHGVAFHVSLLLFGVICLLSGHLIARSGYLPRVIGRLFQLGGACYLEASAATLFFPGVDDHLFPYVLLPPFVGELSLCLWLLLKGVDLPRWRERLGAAPARPAA